MFCSKLICLLVILLISFISTATCQWELCKAFVQECNRDEFVVGGKQMILFSREKNWWDAKNHCEKIGMRLLTTTTKEESEQLINYLNSRIHGGPYIPNVYYWHIWLGLTDADEENAWIWKPNGEAVTFTAWSEGEPNGGKGENCVELKLSRSTNAEWNDTTCGSRKRYICEKPDRGLINSN